MMTVTLELLAAYSKAGKPVREEVRANPLGGQLYEIAQSPGLIEGLAAGDVIKLDSEDHTKFELQEHGGNVCVQIFCRAVTEKMRHDFEEAVRSIGGWLDGGAPRVIVFTIPVTAGLATIEKTLRRLTALYSECRWYYGNIYDPKDGVTPLNWWK